MRADCLRANILWAFTMHGNTVYEISFLLLYKSFLCIEELTRYEAMKLASFVLSVSWAHNNCIWWPFCLMWYILMPSELDAREE